MSTGEPTDILVTGGLGFIGSQLVRKLLEQTAGRVTIVDDLSGTKTEWADIDDHERSRIFIGDLREVVPGETMYDEVWHLASPVGSVGIIGSAGTIASDILDVAAHAHALAAPSKAKLLYVSSSEVYGADGRHDEDSDLIVAHRRGARMEYAIGKLGAEHVLYNLSVDSGVPLRIVRPFNCAGPGQSQELGFVLPTFVAAAIDGRPLPVHGDGTARRAFCHVHDLVDGLLSVQSSGHSPRIYNVGQDSGALTILELAHQVIRRLDSSSVIEHVDPRVEFGKHWLDAFDKVPAIDRVVADTGWSPSRSLDVIIDDVAAHIRGAGAE